MSKKYYYTCPIKALYMMKEFGVKIEGKNLADLCIDIETLSELGIAYGHRKEYIIFCYVSKESQKIFKFKKSDLVIYGFGSVDFYNQISQKNSVSEIIYRNGKQFFMPEVEND